MTQGLQEVKRLAMQRMFQAEWEGAVRVCEGMSDCACDCRAQCSLSSGAWGCVQGNEVREATGVRPCRASLQVCLE